MLPAAVDKQDPVHGALGSIDIDDSVRAFPLQRKISRWADVNLTMASIVACSD